MMSKKDLVVEDMELEGLEVEEIDPIETEIAAVTEEKEKKAKTEGSGLSSTKALAEDEVGVLYIAQLLGIDQRALRAFLRSKYRNMEADKSKRYAWKKDDPQIQEIIDAYRAKEAAPRTRTEKAVDKAEAVEAAIKEVEEVDLEDVEIEEI